MKILRERFAFEASYKSTIGYLFLGSSEPWKSRALLSLPLDERIPFAEISYFLVWNCPLLCCYSAWIFFLQLDFHQIGLILLTSFAFQKKLCKTYWIVKYQRRNNSRMRFIDSLYLKIEQVKTIIKKLRQDTISMIKSKVWSPGCNLWNAESQIWCCR